MWRSELCRVELWRSDCSTDNGKSWTRIGPIAAPLSLASHPVHRGEPYGIIQPSLLDMGNGHIRLYARSRLTIGRICQLAVSRDGERWQDFCKLEKDRGEYSYPALVQARNGDLLMTYTWNRIRIGFARFPLRVVPR
jgi:predicted neuraminidase